jgi:BirA family transcriptional regulator, biotin operon repressor / biotin---[acetyl-CoA-carboxylase] ligase
MSLGPPFVPFIHRHDSVVSTNDTAREMAINGAPEGTVVVASEQTGGRGSTNRSWHSPKGGLYVSVLLHPKERTRGTDLGFLAGIAVAQTIKESLPKTFEVSVKWPNDCLINWKKACGILSESLGESYGNFCIVGVGININSTQEQLAPIKPSPFPPTSFAVESPGGSFDIERILQVFLRKLFDLYKVYRGQGFEPIRFLWERNCLLIGRRLELREHGHTGDRSRGITVGRFTGIDAGGAIVLTNEKGEHHHYHSGEISCFWP